MCKVRSSIVDVQLQKNNIPVLSPSNSLFVVKAQLKYLPFQSVRTGGNTSKLWGFGTPMLYSHNVLPFIHIYISFAFTHDSILFFGCV